MNKSYQGKEHTRLGRGARAFRLEVMNKSEGLATGSQIDNKHTGLNEPRQTGGTTGRTITLKPGFTTKSTRGYRRAQRGEHPR